MKLHFSIGFCGEKPPIYGHGEASRVARFIRKHVRELRPYVASSIERLNSPNCDSSGGADSKCSFCVAKYDLSRFAFSEFETVTL